MSSSKSKRRAGKGTGKSHKKREGPPSPLKVGRPTKRNSGTSGRRPQDATRKADAHRVGVWKQQLGLMDAELRHDKGETWSYDAIRLLLFMVVKGIQESVYTTWQGAKEAITSSIGMAHRVSGCGVSTLKERWAHYSKHGGLELLDSAGFWVNSGLSLPAQAGHDARLASRPLGWEGASNNKRTKN